MEGRIPNYREFWPFYLKEHTNPWTRKIHAVGTILGIGVLALLIAYGQFSKLWIPFVIGYGFAWLSHMFVEKNRPATFKYPLWSFISDFRLTYWVVTGKI